MVDFGVVIDILFAITRTFVILVAYIVWMYIRTHRQRTEVFDELKQGKYSGDLVYVR